VEPNRAEEVYVATLCALAALLVWAGGVDLWLHCHGQPTITAFLRANPTWFYGPLVAILTFIALLTVHLYLTGNR
jgi:hypothetical protein